MLRSQQPRASTEPDRKTTSPLRKRGRTLEELKRNRLLAALPDDVLEELAPSLKPVILKRGAVLYQVGDRVDHVIFVTRGIVSLVRTMRDGRMVEVGGIGAEGVAGINALFDVDTALFETFVQVPGEGYRVPVKLIRQLMETYPDVHDTMEAYVHVVLAQISQTAACNRLHSTEERCCRWLLVCHDSSNGNEFHLTQEFLSVMLGVRRASVTQVAGALQKAGLIRYQRGQMTILDRERLEQKACECYEVVRDFTERLSARLIKV